MAAILVGHHQSGAGKQSWKGAGVTREEVGGNVSVWERTYQRMTGRRKRRVLLQRTGADKWTDKKCPFTGLVSIRGRILTGTVVSTKMHRTLVIRREYLHFVPKYARYEKRHKNLAAHVSPAFRVEEGDQVTVGQCRPLSKTVSRSAGGRVQLIPQHTDRVVQVRFNVLRVLPRTGSTKVKQFNKF